MQADRVAGTCDVGSHLGDAGLIRAQSALMWTHLIKVPLTVRAARPTDIPALLRLQDSSVSTLRVSSGNIMDMGTCVKHVGEMHGIKRDC